MDPVIDEIEREVKAHPVVVYMRDSAPPFGRIRAAFLGCAFSLKS